MDIYWLIGAIIGSGLFIFAGREPALKLIAVVNRWQEKGRRSRGDADRDPWN